MTNLLTQDRVARLKEELSKYKGSQKLIAEKINRSRASVSQMLSGERPPSSEFIQAAVECLEQYKIEQAATDERNAQAVSKLDELLENPTQSN